MKARKPRSGSMQFWPRKRAKSQIPRIRSWTTQKEATPLAFPGYKAGMTHVIATDNRKNSTSAGQEVALPVTILECPPIKIYSVRGYVHDGYNTVVNKEVIVGQDKHLERTVSVSKAKHIFKEDDFSDSNDVSITIFTQPSKIGFKKKPEVTEMHLGGTKEEKLTFIKEHIGKDIAVSDILREGEYVDLHAVTTGRGFQGAVKRFGIGLRSHKSEKGVRAPGSLGGWKGHAHFMYRIAHAGQTGYQLRTQYNNQILKISDKPEEINPKGGFIRYGNVKNTYVLVNGSVPGPKKRIIMMTKPIRAKAKHPTPTVESINKDSKQGR